MFASVAPICSAIDMKRLLKTSSMIGSTLVPMASARLSFSVRVRIRWPQALIWARQPGSTMLVPVGSLTMAGPSTAWPGRMVSRS